MESEALLRELTGKIEEFITGKPATKTEVPKKPEFFPFQLPISYLDDKHLLSETVTEDLELSSRKATTKTAIMYDHLFLPSHSFGQRTIPLWKTHYTTDVSFLRDTQAVIQTMGTYQTKMSELSEYITDCDKLTAVWKDTREDRQFLEKYSYMDWSYLEHLNDSSTFLQVLSIANITSPIMSLILPILFLLFPFVILKIQKIPITFEIYIETLKEIAKNHFIGKTLMNLQTISWDKMAYVLITLGLYAMQIYQNINACFRFYRNVNKINDQLCEMRRHLEFSIKSMETFIGLNKEKSTYSEFLDETSKRLESLREFNEELYSLKPFCSSFTKIFEIGYMLRCYYLIYSKAEYYEAIQYSYGFEGYMNNLSGVYLNWTRGDVSCAVFDEKTEIRGEYYPPHKDGSEKCVKNDVSFDHNMIITGPNASGKTTLLKTTALNIIFSQQVGCGFYRECVLNPYTHIHSYLNIPDTSGRDSLFQAESRRCKEILDIIKKTESARHFCIFDELYSGTNPDDATKSAYSFLLYLSKHSNVHFILTTHYTSLCKRFKKNKNIQNYKMDVVSDQNKIEYTYTLKKGISKIHGAYSILENMDYPEEILEEMRKKDPKKKDPAPAQDQAQDSAQDSAQDQAQDQAPEQDQPQDQAEAPESI